MTEDMINIKFVDYNRLVEKIKELRLLHEKTQRELIYANKYISDLEDELITETHRANKAEERAAHYEKPEESIVLAQHLVSCLKHYLGIELDTESVELYALRRTMEDFERLAPRE